MILSDSKRDVLLLSVCQALLATGNAVVITTSALAGQILAPEGLATMPLFLQFLAIMAATLPASFLMKRIGRQGGFSVGAGFGIVAGLFGCVAIIWGSFWLFCLASIAYGVFMGFGMYYRFAAADVADAAFRPRAISYVLAGGVVAAIAGPELAKATSELLAPALFAGCFAAIAVLGAVTLLVLAFVRIPPPGEEERSGQGRPLSVIMRQPAFLVALGGAAVAQGAMVLIMTATPLAMAFCGFGFSDTAFVIQW
ncbi:MAG: MFS transporter, partial [Geminicoccaceae bacterium]